MVWRQVSVALEADTRGFTRDMKAAADSMSDLGGAAKQNVGGLANEFEALKSKASSAWGTVKKWGGRVAGLAGGFGLAATAAKALTGGWRRLTTLEDATSALTVSLGDATQAAQVMEDVLDTVTGTPYKFDAFASAAQQMVGMGIEAKKVPTYLTAIGEAAATQGGRAQEFADRLSTTFGQIASSGQISLRDVWSISQTGVNALAILANSFGVTRDEMKKMISDGAVPAGQALDALAKGILHGTDGPAGATRALAGTMEQLRENMSGAVGGIGSALDRLGAKLIEPFTPAIVDGANMLADAIDDIGKGVGGLATLLAPVATGFVEIASSAVIGPLSSVAKTFGGIAESAAQSEAAVRVLTVAMVSLVSAKVISGVASLASNLYTYYGVLKLEAQEKGTSTLKHAIGNLGGGAGIAALKFGALTGAVALGMHAWDEYQKPAKRAEANLKDLTNTAIETGDAMGALRDKFVKTWTGVDGGFEYNEFEVGDWRGQLEELGFTASDVADAIENGGDQLAYMTDVLMGMGGRGAFIAKMLNDWHENGQQAADTQRDVANTTRDVGDAAGEAESPMDRMIERLWSFVRLGGMSREAFDEWVAGAKEAAAASLEVDSATVGLPPQIVAMQDAFNDLAEATDNSADRLKAWGDIADALIGTPKAWEDASREWVGTLQDLEKALKDSKGDLDVFTEAGRANQKAISDAVAEALDAAVAYGEQGNGAEDAAAMLEFMRAQLVNTTAAQVGSTEAAEAMVNKYGLTKEAIDVLAVAAQGGKIDVSKLADVMRILAEKGGDAKLEIDEAGEAIVRLPSGKTVTIDVLVRREAYDRLRNDIQRDSGMGSWGQITGARWGGIYKYARGGIHGRQAMIGSGKNLVWWDEPETGGEAYIPRRGDPNRSIPILRETASWYGMGIVPMANGGIRAPLAGRFQPGGAGRSIQFHGGVHITEGDLGVTRDEAAQIAVDVFRNELQGLNT